MSEHGIDPQRKIQDTIIISFVAIFCLYYGITLLIPALSMKIQRYYDKVRTINKLRKRQTEEVDVPVTRVTNLDIQEGTQHHIQEIIPTIKYRIPASIPPSYQKAAVTTVPNSTDFSASNNAKNGFKTKYRPSRRFILRNPSDQRVTLSNMSIDAMDSSLHSNSGTGDDVHGEHLSDQEIGHSNTDTVDLSLLSNNDSDNKFDLEYSSINDNEYAEESEESNMQVPDVHPTDSDAVLTINRIDTLRSLWNHIVITTDIASFPYNPWQLHNWTQALTDSNSSSLTYSAALILRAQQDADYAASLIIDQERKEALKIIKNEKLALQNRKTIKAEASKNFQTEPEDGLDDVVTLSFRFQTLTRQSIDNNEESTSSSLKKNGTVNRRFHVSDNMGFIFDFIECHEYCSLSYLSLEISLSYPTRTIARLNHESLTLSEIGIISSTVVCVTQEE